jgi:hypothetical protein
MRAQRLFPWVLRLAWAALPLTTGAVLAAGLDGRSRSVQLVANIGLWAGWALVLVATLVPHPVGLTALRLAAPAGLVSVLAAVVAGDPSVVATLVGVAGSAVTVALAFAPAAGMLFVNGPSYVDERRYPLRAPGPLLLGPLPLAWAVAVVGPAVGVLLLAAGQWVAGAVVTAVTGVASVVLVRAMHGLSRRWVVFVPAGVVLHDPMTLADPVLFQRPVIERLRPAAADTDSLDLTQRAPGLVVELVLREKVPMTLVTAGNRAGRSGASARLLFAPTRPGRVLAEAATRRLPVG